MNVFDLQPMVNGASGPQARMPVSRGTDIPVCWLTSIARAAMNVPTLVSAPMKGFAAGGALDLDRRRGADHPHMWNPGVDSESVVSSGVMASGIPSKSGEDR